jgi:hypothetical protein
VYKFLDESPIYKFSKILLLPFHKIFQKSQKSQNSNFLKNHLIDPLHTVSKFTQPKITKKDTSKSIFDLKLIIYPNKSQNRLKSPIIQGKNIIRKSIE